MLLLFWYYVHTVMQMTAQSAQVAVLQIAATPESALMALCARRQEIDVALLGSIITFDERLSFKQS
jgi:hypothetical protein